MKFLKTQDGPLTLGEDNVYRLGSVEVTEEEEENDDLKAAKKLEQQALDLRNKAKQSGAAQFPILTGANIEGQPVMEETD